MIQIRFPNQSLAGVLWRPGYAPDQVPICLDAISRPGVKHSWESPEVF